MDEAGADKLLMITPEGVVEALEAHLFEGPYKIKKPTTLLKFMAENQDRRLGKRRKLTAPIYFAYFNSGNYHRARIVNYSEEGMYIESQIPLKLRSSIHFRVRKGTKNCKFEQIRMTGIAEVRWCDEISDSQGSLFGVGIKFYPLAY